MRDIVGPDVDLQILTRSVSGVTLTTQSREGLELQAKLMKEHGTSWDRNFDFMNDVRNLVNTGHPIVKAGMHHQACIALMGLPFASDKVHTAAFYLDIGRRLLESDVQIDSLCLKDASGTTDPKTIYDTAVALKRIMPPEMLLWMHTHDTASTAVAAYSYMSLVPVIQPPILRLMTSRKERMIDMPQAIPISRTAAILFPVVTGIVTCLAIPSSAPLIGMLMFGNLIRESGVTERLRKTAGGIAFAKLLNLFLRSGRKINPCIGAAGVSAVPMAARVVQQFVSRETDGRVNPLMPAMGPNVAGVIGSAVAAGVFLTLLG